MNYLVADRDHVLGMEGEVSPSRCVALAHHPKQLGKGKAQHLVLVWVPTLTAR